MFDKARVWAATILTLLFGLMMLASVVLKFSGVPTMMEKFASWGLADWRLVIAFGELISVVLFLVPRTAELGTLLLSAYLGGAIVTHMQHGESIVVPAAFLLILWAIAALRLPGLTLRLRGAQ